MAVVSSGDPGVFAMAAAVLEVSEDPQWKDVPVRVVPGLTAAQAVASRVGAPLGHDFCVLSLSDRLKPWEVIAARLAAAAARRPGDRDLQPGVEDPHASSWSGPASCCSNTAPRAPRWWSAGTSAARRRRSG